MSTVTTMVIFSLFRTVLRAPGELAIHLWRSLGSRELLLANIFLWVFYDGRVDSLVVEALGWESDPGDSLRVGARPSGWRAHRCPDHRKNPLKI